MGHLLSERIKSTSPLFIRGILKTAANPQIISFAGELPNPVLSPQEGLLVSMERIVRDYGSSLFRYSITVGLPELRQYIADRYNCKFGLKLGVESILITTGSQQAPDLISGVLLNTGDGVTVEKPSYLRAIQAFSQHQPIFYPAELAEEGVDIEQLQDALKHDVEFIYAVPDFQNPTGLSYCAESRAYIREVLREWEIVLVEDDPYEGLHFDENGRIPCIGAGQLPGSILLGTFSETVTPGMRTGFMIYTDTELLKHISMAREASDLHTNIFSQCLIWDYLTHNDYDAHIDQIRQLYKEQIQAMTETVDRYFPEIVRCIRSRGDMFLWVTLPEGVSALSLFPKTLEREVASVPDGPFYINMADTNTMCFNFINTDCSVIDEGVHRLGKPLREI